MNHSYAHWQCMSINQIRNSCRTGNAASPAGADVRHLPGAMVASERTIGCTDSPTLRAVAMTATQKPKIIHALIAERGKVKLAAEYAASLPADSEWRRIIEDWLMGTARFLIAVDLANRILIGTPHDLADVRAMKEIAREEDRGASFQFKFTCSQATASELMDALGVAAVNWTTPATRH